MRRRLHYSPEALSQLDNLDDYLTVRAGPSVAASYLARVLDFCAEIAIDPISGHRRDDLVPGLMTRTFEKKRVICFIAIEGDIHIVGVFGTGQNWEYELHETPPQIPGG